MKVLKHQAQVGLEGGAKASCQFPDLEERKGVKRFEPQTFGPIKGGGVSMVTTQPAEEGNCGAGQTPGNGCSVHPEHSGRGKQS